MFCSKCGAKNVNDAKFCRKCGIPLRQLETTAPPATKPQSEPASKASSEDPPKPQAATNTSQATTSTELTIGFKPNTAGALCYLLGWLTGIAFLVLARGDKFIRFHAWQSILTFAAFTVPVQLLFWLSIIFQGLIFLVIIITFICFILWILLMYQAYKGKIYKLPLAGDLAQKLVDRD